MTHEEKKLAIDARLAECPDVKVTVGSPGGHMGTREHVVKAAILIVLKHGEIRPAVELVGEGLPIAIAASMAPAALEGALDVTPTLRAMVDDMREHLPANMRIKMDVAAGRVTDKDGNEVPL